MKKDWKKPVLAVITKNTSEENVLIACKNTMTFDSGPANGNGNNCHSGTQSGCKGNTAS